ncbi:hypothetical protein [Plantactinospora endophytica]|uniref:Uncharacterized protein n=1 Tax=Plantactinospora endophytica TaxID=673535 RepID=A0ABQ4E7G4_9ACTN|nr:hypothetical protein [Plantactinospora endophytica]GIG90671.1 hypothetical protein Pen02_56070 [Plantactinospora endophytica]
MPFDQAVLEPELEYLVRRQLLSRREPEQLLMLVGDDFEFTGAVSSAESVHIHVKLDDLSDLPHQELRTRGQLERWKAPGYVKYRLPGDLNVIFSSFPIAQDDLIKGAATLPRPFVDHFGVDMRTEDTRTRRSFDEIPTIAAHAQWRSVRQGGPGRPVYGAHTQVAEKYWVYGPGGADDWLRPTEFAYGQLLIDEQYLGCDHRPIDPAHPMATMALPWEESRRASLGDDMKGIVVYVKSDDEARAARAVFDELDEPPQDRLQIRVLSNDRPDEFPDVVVALWRLKESCPLPLTVVDGYPVVTQRAPTRAEAVRITTEETIAPAPGVFQ